MSAPRAFDQRTTLDRERQLMERLAVLREGPMPTPEALDAEVLSIVPFPAKIQLQTTTRCNAACGMCPYPVVTSEPGFDHQEMSLERYENLLGQMHGQPVERLSLFLMNEPLVDKRLADWVSRARAALPETTLGLFTNGSALTGKTAERLAAAGLNELCVSVHGFDAGTYERVMEGLSFARLEKNLQEVFALRDRGELGRLHLQLVSGDVPEVRASMESSSGLLREHALLKAFSNERALVQAEALVPSSRAQGPSRALPPLCHRPFVKAYLLADGSCVLCNCDWRKTKVLGRVGGPGDEPLASVWRGAAYRSVRHQLFTALYEPGLLCRGCDYAAVVGEG